MSKKIKTIEEVKASLIKQYEKDGVLLNEEVEKRISHLKLDDDAVEELFNWFNENDIILSDEDDEDDIIDDEDGFIGEEGSDEPFDDSINKVDLSSYENQLTTSNEIRISDPVKMYLKEIGRVNLLSPEDELEIARRTDEGEEARVMLMDIYKEHINAELEEEEYEKIKIEDITDEILANYKNDPQNLAYSVGIFLFCVLYVLQGA